jgi:hypothetical protein
MKNKNYKAEITMANKFVVENNTNPILNKFLIEMREMSYLSHSDRWSVCYDFLAKNFPEATGTLVTGLTYWLEQ